MKNLVSFFEIPAADFNRAVAFYQSVLSVSLTLCDCCSTEKMAFFPEENGKAPGAISWAKGFNPSKNGVLISLNVSNIDATLALIEENGGTVVCPKTKIEADNMGYFAVFTDSEGNNVGLYSDK